MGSSLSNLTDQPQPLSFTMKNGTTKKLLVDKSILKKQTDQPSDREVIAAFSTLLTEVQLSDSEARNLEKLPAEVKWNMIRQLEKSLMTGSLSKKGAKIVKQKVEVVSDQNAKSMLDLVRKQANLSNLNKFYQWLIEVSTQEDIDWMVAQGGLTMVERALLRAYKDLKQTHDYNTPVILLRISCELLGSAEFQNHVSLYQSLVNAIFSFADPYHIEILSLVLEIGTAICWVSEDGFQVILNAIKYMSEEKNFRFRMEPFIQEFLERSQNIVVIHNVCAFINCLVESPATENTRFQMRDEFLGQGLQVAYEDVKTRIKQKKYTLFAATQKGVAEAFKKKFNIILEEALFDDLDCYVKDDVSFNKIIKQTLSQIEAFEELNKDDNSDASSVASDISQRIRGDSHFSNKSLKSMRSIKSNRSFVGSQGQRDSKFGLIPDNLIELIQSTIGQLRIVEQPAILNSILKNLAHQLSAKGINGISRLFDLIHEKVEHFLAKGANEDVAEKIKQLEVEVKRLAEENKIHASQLEQARLERERYSREAFTLSLENDNLAKQIKSGFKDNNAAAFFLQEYQKLKNKVKEIQGHMTEAYKLLYGGKLNLEFGTPSSEAGISQTLKTQIEDNIHQQYAKTVATLEQSLKKQIQEANFLRKANDELKQHLEDVRGDYEEKIDMLKKAQAVQGGPGTGNGTASGSASGSGTGIIINIPGGAQKQDDKIQSPTRPIPSIILSPPGGGTKIVLNQGQTGDGGSGNGSNTGNGNGSNSGNLNGGAGGMGIGGPGNGSQGNQAQSNGGSGIGGLGNGGLGGDNGSGGNQNGAPTISVTAPSVSVSPPPPTNAQNQPAAPTAASKPPPPIGAPPPPPPKVPPPPPPGGAAAAFKYTGRPRKMPTKKVRPVVWIPLKAGDTGASLWKGMDDTKVKLDFDYLETQFEVQQPGAGKKEEQQPKKEKISLLKPERTKNIEMVLIRLKMQNETIVNSLWKIDRTVLNQNVVESLINCVPNDTEKDLHGNVDISVLAVSDIFVIDILPVVGYDKRLKALQFQYSFQDLKNDVGNKLNTASNLMKKVMQDQSIKTLFLYILAFGNFLNGETPKGDAYGFKIDFLDRLADLKTQDDKQSIMVYLIRQCEKDHQKQIVDPDETFEDLEEGIKLPVQQLQILVGEIRKGIAEVSKAIESQTQKQEDRVSIEFKPFLDECTLVHTQYTNQYAAILKQYEEVCQHFGENSKNTSDVLFSRLLKFKQLCKNSKAYILRQEVLKNKKQQVLSPGKPSSPTSLMVPGVGGQAKPLSNRKSILMDGHTIQGLKQDDKQVILEELKNRRVSRLVLSTSLANSFIQGLKA